MENKSTLSYERKIHDGHIMYVVDFQNLHGRFFEANKTIDKLLVNIYSNMFDIINNPSTINDIILDVMKETNKSVYKSNNNTTSNIVCNDRTFIQIKDPNDVDKITISYSIFSVKTIDYCRLYVDIPNIYEKWYRINNDLVNSGSPSLYFRNIKDAHYDIEKYMDRIQRIIEYETEYEKIHQQLSSLSKSIYNETDNKDDILTISDNNTYTERMHRWLKNNEHYIDSPELYPNGLIKKSKE